MTQTFAKECASWKVRVNAVLPGLTDTKFASALINDDAVYKPALAQIPLGRIAQPQEIELAVLYHASEAASYVTGPTRVVDGGLIGCGGHLTCRDNDRESGGEGKSG